MKFLKINELAFQCFVKRRSKFFKKIIGCCIEDIASDLLSMSFKNIIFYSFLFLIAYPSWCVSLSKEESAKIGKQIWQNECRGTIDGLVSWNPKEEFISLGIGHFIWFSKNYKGPFTQTFPDLKRFLVQRGVSLPQWLSKVEDCPWQSRADFLANAQAADVQELKDLLSKTVDLQTEFIVQRLQAALPKMVANLPKTEKEHITQQFNRVANTKGGFYALIDYCNFKGEGINSTERYNGQGWGLLQVLQSMKGILPGKEALQEFVESAESVLTQRVKNSPAERNEQQWLPGWKNRLKTYLVFAQ